mmetsp:Transcript_9910/g.22528  ORF Transcript_9910/g.22528 Transcript_9910/m.22528 type:complete len:649 (+) Transcript_9910:84-2030(+)
MCGIFAYIGDRQAVQLLITALKRLEYRGYDSAGVGIYGTPLQIRKKVGKVVNLEEACNKEGVEGTVGIAHTRWATHGQPSDTNSHPHTTEDKAIAVVHNGVIENYRALKTELQQKGYNFSSETDTELLAHLVQDLRKQMPTSTWAQVVSVALSLVQGAYGVVFLFQDSPDLLVGARKGSPLILGVGKGEYMLASDASAIVEHTQDVIYLQEGHIVEVDRSSYRIRTIEQTVAAALGTGPGSPRADLSADHPILKLEMSLEEIEKGGYPHFMLKEIMDQPNAIRNAMRGRVYTDPETQSRRMKLGGLEKLIGDSQQSYIERMASANRIIICACGTSWHSGLIAKYALESLAEIPVEVEYASEFRYRKPLISSEDVVIAISQSGETADTLEAIRIAQEFKALTIGIVNVVGSSIARTTDAGLYLHAGPEIGVASTKAFTCQVAALLMLALALAERRGSLSESEMQSALASMEKVPDLIERWLFPEEEEKSIDKQMKMIAKYFRLAPNVLFCGSGVQFPVALEGALKLKEISYIHAEGFPATEIMHGPLTLVRSFMPIIVVAMRSDPAYKTMQKRVDDFLGKNAGLIILTDEGNPDFDGLPCFLVFCPATKLELEPIITIVPLQLFSYYIAEMRGCSIDQPRNLAKSVTVE